MAYFTLTLLKYFVDNLFSDLGGILYSFDPTFDSVKHQQEFDRVVMSGIDPSTPIKQILELEKKYISNGSLKIYPASEAIANLIHNLESHRLIVVSTSLVSTSQIILETLNVPTVGVDIYDFSDFGSKKDVDSWKAIFHQYTSVDVIVEDTPQNLLSASNAAYDLGFKPSSHLTMPLLVK
jgi:FMN phosphatase YigB (HAD superfamily)